jgi:P27 family predicted phage terminase small subunit
MRGLKPRKTKAPVALPGVPKPPASLKGEGLAEWKRVAGELFRLGRLAEIDRGVLLLYCRWWEHVMILDRKLRESTHTVKGQKGNQVTNPLWREFRDATKQTVELQKQLGLTPDARLRQSSIPVSADDGDDSDLDWILS